MNVGVYTTYKKVDNTVTVSGSANLLVINYSYGDTGIPTIAHQIDISAYSGWGEALKGTITAKADTPTKEEEELEGVEDEDLSDCTVESSSFPAKAISPLNSWGTGESFFDSNAITSGDKALCATRWNITITNGSQAPVKAAYKLKQFRCDNATAGRPNAGCVVPWFPSLLTYSKASAPDLVRHVTLAQQSGLPGATYEDPLQRSTNETVNSTNRTLACGDAPSIAGKSCDEYPFATTRNGLANMVPPTRRTFADCNLPNIPSGTTGPKAVSICMIPVADQSYQGGKNAQFYRAERMLEGDPFRVGTVA
ncbi:hypothetical protein ACFU5P_02020 [Streptomyces sp. NPDC057433]|uniref:NucA/NucB deoxyribonuclease domain-containing protein n=1 Tax=Streptomyces sp. NPDC057433 TaxID=3346132 RepID=UPI00368368D6